MYSIKYEPYADILPGLEEEFNEVASTLSTLSGDGLLDPCFLESNLGLSPLLVDRILTTLASEDPVPLVELKMHECQECDTLSDQEACAICTDQTTEFKVVKRFRLNPASEFGAAVVLRDLEKFAQGNRHAFETARNRLHAGKAIGFLGAGASAGLYRTWGSLLTELLDTAQREGLATPSDIAKIEQIDDPAEKASEIEKALGTSRLRAKIQEEFGPKQDPAYTPVMGIVASLPFERLVTTNYDPSILAARQSIRGSSGVYGTWKNKDFLTAWLQGNNVDNQPILYAHGIYSDTETLVLTLEQYEAAYSTRLFKDVVTNLWQTKQLFFVGYGFNDIFLKYLTREILKPLKGAATLPRHTAFVGVDSDFKYSPNDRKKWIDTYNLNPIFYDSSNQHAALLVLLDLLKQPAESG